MNKILKNTLILTAITVIAGTALGLVYEITKDPIAKAEADAKQEACQTVFPEADTFEEVEVDSDAAAKAVESMGTNATVDEVYVAKMGGDEAGYVITTTDKDGYGGNIQISVGIMNDGTVNGISILSIGETAGLGMRATEPEFYNQYAEKKTDKFYVAKDGGESEPIDALSGATITSRAVTGAVNTALGYFQNALGGSGNE
ncbi:MAG: RnfABCDGE type electron transport complex subunit G [bacterium]|nr:RnfABCDGE type electron transport complex subunit G [bacterium]MDD7144142.1 RnfABCDGE type electron transport complex subunit G [bacterium]MDY5457865.1 RnfABCDGE type electron transport complex subunit G [Bariatricus sp.]